MSRDDDDLPLWERVLWGPDEKPSRAAPPTNGHRPDPGASDAYARAAFDAELSRLAAQTKPGRNDMLNRCGFNLAQLVGGGLLDRGSTWTALFDTAVGIGLTTGETAATLASAFDAGMAQPRYGPPPDDEPPPVTVLGDDGEPVVDVVGQRYPHVSWADRYADNAAPEEWVLYPIIPARRIVALFSAPKIGKSLLILELAVAISRGKPALGNHPDRPRRVLYLDFENDVSGDVVPRLKAMGREPGDLDALEYQSFPPLPPLDTPQGGAELLLLAQHYQAEVIIIDTISRAVRGEENDNDTWLAFYRCTGQVLKAHGITCVRLDHTGKDAAKGMRGGSAKYGDVDVAWSMTTVVADSKFQLECVANRMPVPDRLLMIQRSGTPPLAHHLISGSVLLTKVLECAKVLDALGFPVGSGPGTGRDAAIELLEAERYTFTKEVVRQAVARRKESPTVMGPS